MSNSIVAQTGAVDNFSPALRQAIADAAKLQTQVNGRYEAAIELLALGAVRVNEDGSVDVASRSGGELHHLNGRSCDCKDATFNAPVIAGRKACAHQVAGWMALKARTLAMQPAAPAPDQTSRSCWFCRSLDLSQGDLCGQAGRCHYCGSKMPESAPATAATLATPAASAPTAGTLTLAQLREAAAKVNGGVSYSLQPTHIGGHGYAQLLQAEEDAEGHETYLICGDWQEDALFVAQWGMAWGQVDAEAMATLGVASRPAQVVTVLGETVTLPVGVSAVERPVRAELAYYLESAGYGVKLMVSHGQMYPRCVGLFRGEDRLEQARAEAEKRARGHAEGMRKATGGTRGEVRVDLLPARWRQRMGGFQVGKAWVVYG